MDETYRKLGRGRQDDLEREAADWRLARQARKQPQPPPPVGGDTEKPKARRLHTLLPPLRFRGAAQAGRESGQTDPLSGA